MKRSALLFIVSFFLITVFPFPQDNKNPHLFLVPEAPRPGDPVTVILQGEQAQGEGLHAVLMRGQNRFSGAAFFDYDLGEGKTVKTALLAVPSTVLPGEASIRVERRNAGEEAVFLAEKPLGIARRDFASETITLNEDLTRIRTEDDPRKTAEAEQVWAIFNRTGNSILAEGYFRVPVASTRRTSRFGDRRVFQYSNGKTGTSIHAGVDYGVPKGTRVDACAAGKVVLARSRIVTGNSVILEHLPGVYSLYYHLDSITCKEGQTLASGEELGLSGATGLATGPHLHWEIRVSGENADPDAFISRPVLDKKTILAIIK
ncbi:MAG: M23 family metallopeptidase [Treponema sp.]|jgi:murein DD-endopeptidase MepM/ murein hydrolase activator NlpD|nr:M23 family metallopeptidase [Treponema sp.]